ncbi:MAG: hypothetical protein ACXAC5_02695 [Promethearchaeota archaeon]
MLAGGLVLLGKWIENRNPVCFKHQVSKVGVTNLNGRVVGYRCAQCEIERAMGVD